MCLYTKSTARIKKADAEVERIGFKLVSVQNNGDYWAVHRPLTKTRGKSYWHIPKRKWLKADQVTVGLNDDLPGTYKTGFHILPTIEDALEYCKWNGNIYEIAVVKYRNLRIRGCEKRLYTHELIDVWVADDIYYTDIVIRRKGDVEV